MTKVALVTGGSRGIGLGIVKQLAQQGFNIAINGVRPAEGVADVLASIKALGVEVIYCQGNVALSADRAKILQAVKDHFGQLNILVNNAGIAPRERRDVLNTSEVSFDEVLDTNLKSCYFLTQAAANWMIEQKESNADFSGSIINISSISATVASVNRGEYCVSKAGISMVTQLFAARLGEYFIPVYEVRPGVIATDMTAGVKEKYDNLIAQGLCVQPRWGTPEDVGKAVGALAMGSFPYSTGQVFMVDGGLTMPRL
ncbi:3-ketoacyl-ACP reductase [Haliscomenobacter hydrossis]|uniref:3-oxoacyl-(Acyl-carrier-protein) reductase n=1 Tax=Haliscomenobacter hydrossis (strain ATCC 27775 / DSM 1100 / LMG 10767 / O) TaxID=760192 RepID=F4L103_HALH1|nr:3-ketoacyl-ACP reductase [Haliscomenobacter hydrossis]AEE51590.1 3-oxoacyl-(acyl-carrier-protein) reductase [Haliscomenobacter hydrossis DSM 1100]